VFSGFVGGLGLFGVFEDSFLAVDYSCDHAVGFLDVDEALVLEFVEAVVDFAVGECGGGFDLLGVGVAAVDLMEDCAVFVA